MSFVATVSTPLADFNVPLYTMRTRARFNTDSVSVSVAAGSVIVTTELGTDSEETANGMVDTVNNMDDAALESLFDAPAVVDSVGMQSYAPPSAPPSEELDHVLISLIVIFSLLVPASVFAGYLWYEKATHRARTGPKPYALVITEKESPTAFSFKFEL